MIPRPRAKTRSNKGYIWGDCVYMEPRLRDRANQQRAANRRCGRNLTMTGAGFRTFRSEAVPRVTPPNRRDRALLRWK